MALAMALTTTLGWSPAQAAESLREALHTLASASPHTDSQEPLREAWQVAVSVPVGDLPQLFSAMRQADVLGANWLRAAIDAVVERQLAQGHSMSPDLFEKIVVDRSHSPQARRLAFEWLTKLAPSRRSPLLEGMLDDPSLELRYDAVAKLLAEAEAQTSPDTKVALLQECLHAARDVEQIKACAASLQAAGTQVDLAQVLGFLTQWRVIGPFDNRDLAGFAAEFGPQRERDFARKYPGKDKDVAWQEHITDEEFAVVDLNKVLGDDKEVVAYAVTTLQSPQAQPAQVRLGSKNAPQVWVNGTLVGRFEVYHAGYDIDQYVMPVDLQAGENEILVKICQNAKRQSWEREWQFHLRVTDAQGTPIGRRPGHSSGEADQGPPSANSETQP
jgi:hypothetical protein